MKDHFAFAVADSATGQTTVFGAAFRSVAARSALRFIEASPDVRNIVPEPRLTGDQNLEVQKGRPVTVTT